MTAKRGAQSPADNLNKKFDLGTDKMSVPVSQEVLTESLYKLREDLRSDINAAVQAGVKEAIAELAGKITALEQEVVTLQGNLCKKDQYIADLHRAVDRMYSQMLTDGQIARKQKVRIYNVPYSNAATKEKEPLEAAIDYIETMIGAGNGQFVESAYRTNPHDIAKPIVVTLRSEAKAAELLAMSRKKDAGIKRDMAGALLWHRKQLYGCADQMRAEGKEPRIHNDYITCEGKQYTANVFGGIVERSLINPNPPDFNRQRSFAGRQKTAQGGSRSNVQSSVPDLSQFPPLRATVPDTRPGTPDSPFRLRPSALNAQSRGSGSSFNQVQGRDMEEQDT